MISIVKGDDINNTLEGYEVKFDCLYSHYTESILYRANINDIEEFDFYEEGSGLDEINFDDANGKRE